MGRSTIKKFFFKRSKIVPWAIMCDNGTKPTQKSQCTHVHFLVSISYQESKLLVYDMKAYRGVTVYVYLTSLLTLNLLAPTTVGARINP